MEKFPGLNRFHDHSQPREQIETNVDFAQHFSSNWNRGTLGGIRETRDGKQTSELLEIAGRILVES